MRALEACRLRWMNELTYEQIARRLGYGSRAAAYNAIWRLNRRLNNDQRADAYAKASRKRAADRAQTAPPARQKPSQWDPADDYSDS